jgi:hypothetical protein
LLRVPVPEIEAGGSTIRLDEPVQRRAMRAHRGGALGGGRRPRDRPAGETLRVCDDDEAVCAGT